MYVCMNDVCGCMWRLEDNVLGCLSFHHVGSGDQNLVTGLAASSFTCLAILLAQGRPF